MPNFYTEAQHIEVDVDEFLSDCTDLEIKEVIEYLRDNDHIKEEETLSDPPRGYNERNFENALLKLQGNSHFLSTDEEELIVKLSQRIP